MGKNKNFGADLTDFVGEAARKQTHFFAKKHVLSPCLGTSPWVGRFGCRVHTKNNGSICITFATMVGKGLINEGCVILLLDQLVLFITYILILI